jgi:lambda family phage minor tail protein L
MAIPFSEAQLPAPSALIDLYELQLVTAIHGVDTVYRFHAGIDATRTGDVIWAGNSYLAFPVEVDGFSYSGTGQLPRPSLKVSNVMGTITALLLGLPAGLEGAKVTRIRTHARYLDAVNFPGNVNPLGAPDPTAEYPREVFYVDQKKSEGVEMVEYALASVFDLAGVRAPKRQVTRHCPWIFPPTATHPECGYAGPLPTCAKTLAACREHFGNEAELPFGGFPGAGSYAS